ncbi:MAG: hypothetical protein ONB11_06995 [candidate division KSB1 bacterium]|nr:hypothetical protein [candidate division KSB1 bacterium]
MNRKFFHIIISAMQLLPLANLWSQTSISVTQNSAYYSNSFYNSQQLPDLNNEIGLSIAHVFEGEQIQSQLYYQGDLNLFQKFSDRLYHNQAFGYDGYTNSDDEQKALYFGGNLLWHDGQQDYNIYDYWKLQGYVNARIDLRSNLIGRFGYQLSNKTYSQLPEFNYWEHSIFARLNTYFQTGTSLTLLVNYGLKDYIPLATSSGQGRGRRAVVEYIEMPSVDQLVTSFKLAQSLGMKTSLSLEYLNRLHPGLVGGSAAVMNSNNLFTEDELFDDRYGYSGHELTTTFTHFLPGYVKLELNGSRVWKNYLNRQVYDSEGNLNAADPSRQDQRWLAWFEISRSFKLNRGIKNLGLSLQGGYLKNDSNDPFYQFDNYFISMGINLKFAFGI